MSNLPPDGSVKRKMSPALERLRRWRERYERTCHTTGRYVKGEVFKMSDGRTYQVAPDGSFRRVRKANKPEENP